MELLRIYQIVFFCRVGSASVAICREVNNVERSADALSFNTKTQFFGEEAQVAW